MMSSIQNELETKGYCVVPGILTQHEVNRCIQSFQDWQGSIKNHDSIYPKIVSHGIYKYHNAGHTWHSWYIRTRPMVQDVFKTIWKTDSLITSFDGCCYIPQNCTKKDNIWAHSDQAPNSKGFQCYQSFVSLTENKERTFVVYEGTHKDHEAYFKERNIESTKNWQLIDHDYIRSIEHKKRILHVPVGAMVLWDSRTFHQNQYGAPNSETRMAQYVCFFPKNHPQNTPAMQKKRNQYYDQRRTTTHWPCPIRVNSLQPQTYGNTELDINYDTLPPSDLSEFCDDIPKLL